MKKNFIIGIPKFKQLIIPPISKQKKGHNRIIPIKIIDETSKISLLIPYNLGLVEQDLLYAYLLIVLNDKSTTIQKENLGHDFFNSEKLLQRTTIRTSTKYILQLLKKNVGGSSYKQLYNSNLKLSQSILTWKLHHQETGQVLVGASNLIDFCMDNGDIIIKLNAFYLYYLLRPCRNQLRNLINTRWSRYTLLNLQERFQLKSELQRYIHEWLSHDIFPNDNTYTIKVDKIMNDIKAMQNIIHPDNIRWERNTRYNVTQAIKGICKTLKNWELVGSHGRGITRSYKIKRSKFF